MREPSELLQDEVEAISSEILLGNKVESSGRLMNSVKRE